ncbi:methenyltetrahydrofolate synthase domain-containing protein isoform X1 [Brienomyrus brachyistius]|uniref:methenyltetrahydrofolate synthase domain-containing protein isoform X1 n=1 Tax=Brienomyrus brachyistius TaxID=42636 RepID=UPI0020B3C030|nr:methenyltetrahydrofolate synthase domain-containing protein isoform X1 [Brienomyrus brachyistius]
MEPVIKLNPGATKWDIRQKVWDYIEANNLAHFPRPVHNRIPNFKGAHCACAAVADLEPFRRTSEVKVDPDKPLEGARLEVLQARKTLLVPTPRLRAGLFNRIVPPQGASTEDLRVCSTSQGVKNFSVPVGLDAKVSVDLVVVGSVAVSQKGYRIGKGEGYADMEYAMMVSMGAISSATVVVTVVHDCQVVDIPEELIECHDLTVDYILTPTRVIRTECKRPKPQGIIWAKLNADMLERIPVLQKLRALEQKSGKDVSLGKAVFPGEAALPGGGRDDAIVDDTAVTTLYLGGVPAGLRVSELKSSLHERRASPRRLIWQGAHGRAFLEYGDHEKAQAALTALQALSINGHNMQVAFARGQRSRRGPGVPHRTAKATESQTPGRSLKRS